MHHCTFVHNHFRVSSLSQYGSIKGRAIDESYSSVSRPKRTDASNQKAATGQEIIWINAIAIISFHIVAVIAFFLTIHKMKSLTITWLILYGGFSGFGVTAGAHRYWSHRSYKARLPFQIILLISYSAAGMNSLFDWVRDHRVHHKFSETDADPHNANRGFFFSHVGWLMKRKHPEVRRKGKTVDMSDIVNDPVLKFHTRYFLIFKMLFAFVLPTLLPIYLWQEDIWYAFCSQVLIRYTWILNATWSVNSFAHLWGGHPYDKRINPGENIGVAIVAIGEGWHNYHHVFPWDYKAAELGNYGFNYTTMLLDVFYFLGLVYEPKTASPALIETVKLKHGDGSRPIADM